MHLPDGLRLTGALMAALGALLLVDAFVRFVAEGAGTPAPVAPTDRLVVGGPYRWVRNPMYLAVLATILGQALLGRPLLLAHAVVVGIAVAAFVRRYEEPTLADRYGAAYDDYRQ
jgi:protein-S-isoprenylcysteine O-methyltransferase Ste14